MKRKTTWIITGIVLLITGSISLYIVSENEKEKQYPVERYMEQNGTTEKELDLSDIASGTDSKNEFQNAHSLTNRNVKFEFLGYELIEDTEIEKQIYYIDPAHYDDQSIPDADGYDEYDEIYDLDRMYNDFPEYLDIQQHKYDYSYEEYLERYEKTVQGLDWSEYYLGKGHKKTYYCFIKMHITNLSDDDTDCCLNELYLIWTNKEKSRDDYTDNMIYFDHPQNVDGEERLHRFTWYHMKKRETLDCIIGYKIEMSDFDYIYPETPLFYIGTISSQRQDMWENQTISNTVIPLYDLPSIKHEEVPDT